MGSKRNTCFNTFCRKPFDFCHFACICTVFFDSRLVFRSCKFFNIFVFRCYNKISYTVNRVRTGCINRNLKPFNFFNFKSENCTVRFTNPVCLHCFNVVTPTWKFVEVFKKNFRVISNFEEPLRKIFFLNNTVTSPAFTIDYLFVSENGSAFVTPVNSGFFFIGKTFFIQLQEQPLSPFVIIRLAGRNFTVPIVRKPEHFKLFCHISNVFICPGFRISAVFHCCVFCRQPETVPAHWMKNIKPLRLFKTRNYVCNRVVSNVSHMEFT